MPGRIIGADAEGWGYAPIVSLFYWTVKQLIERLERPKNNFSATPRAFWERAGCGGLEKRKFDPFGRSKTEASRRLSYGLGR